MHIFVTPIYWKKQRSAQSKHNSTDFVSRGTFWIWKQQCKHSAKHYKRTKTSTRYGNKITCSITVRISCPTLNKTIQKKEIWKGHQKGYKIKCSETVRISCPTVNKTIQKDEIWKGHHNGCKIKSCRTVRISCPT